MDLKKLTVVDIDAPEPKITTAESRNKFFSLNLDKKIDNDEIESTLRKQVLINPFEHHLQFSYKGDLFGQRGIYTEANVYLSRLSPNRKVLTQRHKQGAKSKTQVKLAPVQQASEETASVKPSKHERKRQYALAVEAMAANPILHKSLLNDNVIPCVVAMCRVNDAITVGACISTLCYLSCEAIGREAILSQSSLSLLANLVMTSSLEKRQLHNGLAILANLTIEDTFESLFIKEKALDSMTKHRKSSVTVEAMCTFALFNLTCPAYSYPRIDDLIRALVEHGKDCRDRETLSRAIYNLSYSKMNQSKLIEPDTISLLRHLVKTKHLDVVRCNALASFWHLSENSSSRKAMIRSECVAVLVEELSYLENEGDIKCALSILINLSSENMARELMGNAKALNILGHLAIKKSREEILFVIYKLIAIILSAPMNIYNVDEEFLDFLLAYQHNQAANTKYLISRFVLFSLACIMSWYDNQYEEENDNKHDSIPAPSSHHSSTKKKFNNSVHLEQLLDMQDHLPKVYEHISFDGFRKDGAEAYLQMLLLYNVSFRYNRTKVTRLASTCLKDVGANTENPQILSLVCGTLFSLSQEYQVHEMLLESGLLNIMETLARKCDDDGKAMCLEVVCIIFDAKTLQQECYIDIVRNTFPVVIEISSSDSAKIRAGCASCLARFCMVEECQVMMVQNGLIDSLAILVSRSTSTEQVLDEDTQSLHAQTLRLCVHAYSYLSRDPLICSNLIHNGIVKSLICLAAAPEESVRRACAMTFCNLSAAEENISALVKYGALRALLVISCVKSNDPATRRICMKAVLNLLRIQSNITQMCNDGLLWAFSFFISSMEPRDYDILADTFSGLSFYEQTRKGMLKPSSLTALFEILASNAANTTKSKVLKGIINLLTERGSANLLINAGILPYLCNVVENTADDLELERHVIQVMAHLFQNCPDMKYEFAQENIMQSVIKLMKKAKQEDVTSCAMFLHLLSLQQKTCTMLVTSKVFCSIPSIMKKGTKETQLFFLRSIYNASGIPELISGLCTKEIIESVSFVAQMQYENVIVANLCAAIMRNFSCDNACQQELISEQTTKLLKTLFELHDNKCKEDVATCVCNLFLGKVNSNSLLSHSVLPLVLWLSTQQSSESLAICSATLRKLSIPPGNSQVLVDGGVIPHLITLMQTSNSLYVKKNCVACFCLLSRKTSIPALLCSYGVISAVLELLESFNRFGTMDHMFEIMCLDLLSTLAEFVRANVPQENKLSSTLFHLVENNERYNDAIGDVERLEWQTDREFLQRSQDGDLPLISISTRFRLEQHEVGSIISSLYAFNFQGHSVDFHQSASQLEVRSIEPVFPSTNILGESHEHNESSSVDMDIDHAQFLMKSSSFEFIPPKMYPKIRDAFGPIATAPVKEVKDITSSRVGKRSPLPIKAQAHDLAEDKPTNKSCNLNESFNHFGIF